MARKRICDERVSAGSKYRLGDAHARARDEQLDITACEATTQGHAAPYQHGDDDQVSSVATIDHARQRHPCEAIKDREGIPLDEAYARVGKVQIELNGLHEH